MRTYTIKNVEHPVYEDLSELPEGLVYLKDWKKAQIGDWVLADDGCIIQILRKSQMKTKYRKQKAITFFGTCTGTFSEKAVMDTERRDNIYTISGKRTSSNLTKNEILFSQHVVRGVSPEDAYLKVFRTNSRRYAKLQSGILIKSERIRKIMKEELKPVMQSLGICPELVLAGIRDIATDEEAKDSDKLKALFELGEILELKETQRTTEVSGALFQGFEPKQLEKAERPKLNG